MESYFMMKLEVIVVAGGDMKGYLKAEVSSSRFHIHLEELKIIEYKKVKRDVFAERLLAIYKEEERKFKGFE